MIYSPVYSRSTAYFYLFVVCILAPFAFNLVTVRLWSDVSHSPYFEKRRLLEGSTYFDINGNGAALIIFSKLS